MTSTRTITIVGPGGRDIAVRQAWHYAALKEQQPELPPLHIRLIDGAGGVFPEAVPEGLPVTCEILKEHVFGLALTDHSATVFGGRGVHASDALVLAAPPDSLLRLAEQERALRRKFGSAAIIPGRQNHPLLFVAGGNDLETARLSVEQALHIRPAIRTPPKGDRQHAGNLSVD